MPLITRRSSTRATPRGLFGSNDSISRHSTSLRSYRAIAKVPSGIAPGGLSCFFMPRWTPDGDLNALRFQRLKDKLGNRSNAS